jgi:hypothetical protein
VVKEYDSIPIDEVDMKPDGNRHRRCLVCGHPWHGTDRNGGRDHPPGGLWRIMPIGFAPLPVDPPQCLKNGWPCHMTEPQAYLAARGITITPCAVRRPPEAPPEEGENPKSKLRRLPSEVTLIGVTPPPLVPRPVTGGPSPSLNGSRETS